MTAPIDKILPHLTKVRQRQPGQWSARCPAHDDKGPSLSVRETPEGAVLMHCFAGCVLEAVVASIGLNTADLYPPRQLSGREPKRTPRLLTDQQALELLDKEAHRIVVTGLNLRHGVALTDADLEGALAAAGRISWLRSECMGGNHAHR